MRERRLCRKVNRRRGTRLRILVCAESAVSLVEVVLVYCRSVNQGRGMLHFGSREVGNMSWEEVEGREENSVFASLD